MTWYILGEISLVDIVGAISVLGGMGLTAWTIHAAGKKDAITARSGIVSDSRADTALLIDNLYKMLEAEREDSKDDATRRSEDRDTIKQCADAFKTCSKERDELLTELARLRRRYGLDDSPPAGTPTTT